MSPFWNHCKAEKNGQKERKKPSPVMIIECSHPLNQPLISHNVFPVSNPRCLCRRCPWYYKDTARLGATNKSCLWSCGSCAWRIYGHKHPRYLTIRKACSFKGWSIPSRSPNYATSGRSSCSTTEFESDSKLRSDNPSCLQRGSLPRLPTGKM